MWEGLQRVLQASGKAYLGRSKLSGRLWKPLEARGEASGKSAWIPLLLGAPGLMRPGPCTLRGARLPGLPKRTRAPSAPNPRGSRSLAHEPSIRSPPPSSARPSRTPGLGRLGGPAGRKAARGGPLRWRRWRSRRPPAGCGSPAAPSQEACAGRGGVRRAPRARLRTNDASALCAPDRRPWKCLSSECSTSLCRARPHRLEPAKLVFAKLHAGCRGSIPIDSEPRRDPSEGRSFGAPSKGSCPTRAHRIPLRARAHNNAFDRAHDACQHDAKCMMRWFMHTRALGKMLYEFRHASSHICDIRKWAPLTDSRRHRDPWS